MARTTWKHPAPAVNPFEAVAGDLSTYSVHLCEAHEHANEEVDVLVSVLGPALDAAKHVTRDDARYFLCDFDPVYSALTVVVTDGDRQREEHHVYKLIFHDWDRSMQSSPVPDSDYEALCRAAERRVYELADAALRRACLSEAVEALKARGFEFWFTTADAEEWEHLDV